MPSQIFSFYELDKDGIIQPFAFYQSFEESIPEIGDLLFFEKTGEHHIYIPNGSPATHEIIADHGITNIYSSRSREGSDIRGKVHSFDVKAIEV